MKNLFFGLISLLLVAACSTDESTTGQSPTMQDLNDPTVQKDALTGYYFNVPSSPTEPMDWTKGYLSFDAEGKRPVTLAYWHCGSDGFVNVYTNGNSTYYSTIVAPGTPGSYMMIDEFSQSIYWVTTHWGSASMCN